MTGFGQILADLDRAGVRYVLIGGIALIRHGVARATRDSHGRIVVISSSVPKYNASTTSAWTGPIEVLRRAEAGEDLTITVSGRPVAQLGPLGRSPWVPAAQVRHVWDTPAPIGLAEDLDQLDLELVDPFETA